VQPMQAKVKLKTNEHMVKVNLRFLSSIDYGISLSSFTITSMLVSAYVEFISSIIRLIIT
jgi:hypothetical protein